MQRLIALLLDSDKNQDILREREDIWHHASSAYQRPVCAFGSMRARHPLNMAVTLTKRESQPTEAGTPAMLILSSKRGSHNYRGWEARIPVVEHEGEIFVEDPEGIGTLLSNSSHSASEDYLYSYPVEIRALLAVGAKVILHIANHDSMVSGRTEMYTDEQGWTSVFYPRDKYDQLELLTWWFGEQKERFHKEAQEAREYVAFRTSESDEGDGMVVYAVREREFKPASVYEDDEDGHEKVKHLKLEEPFSEEAEKVASLYEKDPDDHLDALKSVLDENGEDVLYQAIRSSSDFFWDYDEVLVTQSAAQKKQGQYSVAVKISGEAEYTHSDIDLYFRLLFQEDEDGDLCLMGGGTLSGRVDDTRIDIQVSRSTALSIFCGIAVRCGIYEACEGELVELDEKDGRNVPLDDPGTLYADYLRLGIDNIFSLCDKVVDPESSDAKEWAKDERYYESIALMEDTIRKASSLHPAENYANDSFESMISCYWHFDDIVYRLCDSVESGYPVIFKEKAAFAIQQKLKELSGELAGKDSSSVRMHMFTTGIFVYETSSFRCMITYGSDYSITLACYRLTTDTTRKYSFEFYLGMERTARAFDQFIRDVAASKEPVLYFVAASDNKTRRSLVDGRELLATSLTPADILYLAYQHGMNMPAMVVEKALPGQRGLLVRTNITK